MAQDITGRELAVGQMVAYCVAGRAQAMRLSKVTHVRAKTVELEDRPNDWSEWGIRRNHSAVCIVA